MRKIHPREPETLRNIAATIVTTLLAACSAGSNSTLPAHPSVTNTVSSAAFAQERENTFPRRVIGKDGHAREILYRREIESSGRVSNNAASVPADGLQYWGGLIQTKPQIYVVYWGNWGAGGDPMGERARLNYFLKGIGGSAWLSTVTQYTQTNGAHVGNASSFDPATHAWNDTTRIPDLTNGATYGDLIAAEAQKAVRHFGNSTASASYVIAVPHNTPVAGFGYEYCAWHSYTTINGANVAYTNLPYIPDPGYACGQGSVTNPGYDDGVSIVEGHEQAETETDPQVNAWLDNSGNEIGDKCAWVSLQNTHFSTGIFPTQPLWSNNVDGCVQ
jgi:serine protease